MINVDRLTQVVRRWWPRAVLDVNPGPIAEHSGQRLSDGDQSVLTKTAADLRRDGQPGGGMDPVYEALTSDRARRALAERDIATVYRLLTEAGVAQRQIADLTGQSQSEVCEILKGRQVVAYEVLVRIANALDVPRGWMGLGYGEDASPLPSPVEEVDENVKRRALLAAGSVALVGSPVLGELLHIPAPPATLTPLPSRLGVADVAAIKSLTTELRTVTRSYGGGADVVTSVAQRSLPLMSVPTSESIKAGLGAGRPAHHGGLVLP